MYINDPIWFAVTLILAVIVIVLLWRGYIRKDVLTWADKSLEKLVALIPEGSTNNIDRLVTYAHYAVHAVEQLANTGMIEPQERKEKAEQMIEDMARTDDKKLFSGDWDVIDMLIEAECDKMGHEKMPVMVDGLNLDVMSCEELLDFCRANGLPLPEDTWPELEEKARHEALCNWIISALDKRYGVVEVDAGNKRPMDE